MCVLLTLARSACRPRSTLFRICKFADINEEVKLDFIKEIGFCHMRVLDGLDTLLQLTGLVAKLCVTAAGRGARPPKK